MSNTLKHLQEYLATRKDRYMPLAAVVCADGLRLSVQCSANTYCTPRRDRGPWSAVEVGFPSETVSELMEYAEDDSKPTQTVYGYVPIGIVADIITAHGGFKVKP